MATNFTANHADFMALSAALAGERPIAYSVNLARITGDVKATLFISQLIYWTRVGTDVEHHGGWIFKSREQWTTETGLSRYEQESARAKLIKQGLIEEARVGSPARNCYRVVPQVLGSALARLLRSEPVQWTLFDIRSNADQFKALLGRNLAFYRIFTEITPTVAAAVFLTKAISVHRNVLNAQLERQAKATQPSLQSNDWFSLSPSQWQDETGLTSAQQRECKQKLCQLNFIEEAIQTYPKRRTYIQLSLPTVSAALKSYVLTKIEQGGSAHGLLGVLARGMRNGIVLSDKMSVKNKCTSSDILSENNVSKESFDKIRRTSAKESFVETKTRVIPQEILAVCEIPPSSFHDSTNLDGGFSHISRMEITHKKDGNSTVRRGLLTGLHARAGYLTTKDLNTTTTTTLESPPAKTIHQDGGKSHEVVVVVSDVENQEKAELVWFEWMQPFVKQTCSQLLQTSQLGFERQQVLIAELAGNLLEVDKIKNPLTYFSALIRREKETHGGIAPLVAHVAWAKHEAKIIADRRLAKAISQPIQDPGSKSSTANPSGAALTPGQIAGLRDARARLAEIRKQIVAAGPVYKTDKSNKS